MYNAVKHHQIVTAPQNICSTMLFLGKYMYLPLLVTSTNFSQPHFKEISVSETNLHHSAPEAA